MPSADFLSCMSRDFTKLLENKDECNVTIKVGAKGKLYRAHSVILRARSSYFARELSKRGNSDGSPNKWVLKMPEITPPVFELILRYIYGGNIQFEKVDNNTVLNFLAATGLLQLTDLYDHLQDYIIDEKSSYLREYIVTATQISEKYPSFKKLANFVKVINNREPNLYFSANDFSSLPEKSLVRLLARDDLAMEEIEIWDRVLKWGIDNTPQMPRVRRGSGPNFPELEKTLRRCIPHIRLFHISANDFKIKVSPYKQLLPSSLYGDLLQFHSNKNFKVTSKILEPRHGRIASEIIDMRQAAQIASWIDRKDCDSANNEGYKIAENPYELSLLTRGTRDGFTAKAFHEHCDDRGSTIVLMKVKNSSEIIGAYNPLHWESNLVDLATNDAFLFSMQEGRNPILSRIKSAKHAIVCAPDYGPMFGAPYALAMRDNFDDVEKTGCSGGVSASYNVSLRSADEKYFWIDEYEVFQVQRKFGAPVVDECVGK